MTAAKIRLRKYLHSRQPVATLSRPRPEKSPTPAGQKNFFACQLDDFARSGTEMAERNVRFEGSEVAQSRGGFAVTIVASPRGQQDVMTAEVFSWNELPDLMAAEELFDSASPYGVDESSIIARGDEDADEEEDEEDDDYEDDDDELEDDEEEEEEDEEELEGDDDEWEEVDDEDEEEEDEEDEEEEEDDEDWEDDDEEWEDEDEEEEEDDDD